MLLTRYNKIAILTNEQNNPAQIAQKVKGLPVIMYVFERLGYPDEKIIEGAPDVILKRKFLTPNVVILQKRIGEKTNG